MKWRIASIVLIVLLVAGGCVGGITVTSLGSQLNELEASYASLRTQFTSLESSHSSLKTDYSSLQSRFDTVRGENVRLSADNAQLGRDLTSAKRTIDDLQKLAPPFNYYPQRRSEYTVKGYIPTPGKYSIAEPSILVSFPNAGKYFIYGRPLGTGSMQPFFGAGASLIETKGFTTTDIAVGDIVTWEDPTRKMRIIHQVIKVLPNGVVTKGFNNLKDDGLIPWTWVQSLVIGVIF